MNTRSRHRRHALAGIAAALLLPSALRAQTAPAPTPSIPTPMKIRILTGDTVVPVTLEDNATARDFVSLLPLTLTLEDYAATEKVATLPRKLTTQGAPEGTAAEVGDVTYYAPWGNLAIFHKPFRHSAGLIRLGRVDSGIEHLRLAGNLPARIEVAPRQADRRRP